MKFSRLLFMSVKRTLLSPVFVLLLFFLPLITLITGIHERFSVDNKTEKKIPVAYFISANNEDSNDGYYPFTGSDTDSMYSFHECDSESVLRDEVLSGKAECGYVIPTDIFAVLATGDTKGKVQVYISPASTQTYIVNETVYAEIFKKLAPLLLRNYIYEYSEVRDRIALIDGNEINGKVFSEDVVYELYDDYSTNGSTFSVVTDTTESRPTSYTDNNNNGNSPDKKTSAASLRGLLSVLVMLCGFCGVLKYFDMADNPVLSAFKVRLCTIMSPLLLSMTVSESCLLLSALFGNKNAYALAPGNPLQKLSFISGSVFISEISGLMIFMILCILLLLLLSYLIPERSLFCAFMPVYLLSALIFTPVFIDIPSLMPVFRFVKVLFPSVWYI